MTAEWWAKCLAVGAAGGLLGGLLGVGGGIVMVPMLMFLLGENIVEAKATSLAIIISVAIAGSIQHHRDGKLTGDQWPVILAAGLAAAAFGMLGAFISKKIPTMWLQRAFAVLLIATAIQLLLPKKPAAPAIDEATVEPQPAD